LKGCVIAVCFHLPSLIPFVGFPLYPRSKSLSLLCFLLSSLASCTDTLGLHAFASLLRLPCFPSLTSLVPAFQASLISLSSSL
jgi:hypothetical protein